MPKHKKAYKEVTLHSICEVKEFGQVTVEQNYKHTSYVTIICNNCLASFFVTDSSSDFNVV